VVVISNGFCVYDGLFEMGMSNADENVGEESALDRLGQMIWELFMWRDTAKSSLWFGCGCLCFLSSCFTKGLNIR